VASNKHKGLDKILLKDFSELPKDVDYGDYGVINVSPSVVPAYFPSFRIFNYNVSSEAVEEALERKERRLRGETFRKKKPPHGHRKPDPRKPRTDQCKRDKYKDSWRCHFSKDDWRSDPEAPSRKNGLMSPLGYAQVSLELSDPFLLSGSFVWRFCRLAYITSLIIPFGCGAYVYHLLLATGACDGPRVLMRCSIPPFSPGVFRSLYSLAVISLVAG
jgi:hypothetical protein